MGGASIRTIPSALRFELFFLLLLSLSLSLAQRDTGGIYIFHSIDFPLDRRIELRVDV